MALLMFAAYWGSHFSKVLFIVTLDRTGTRALTFQNAKTSPTLPPPCTASLRTITVQKPWRLKRQAT